MPPLKCSNTMNKKIVRHRFENHEMNSDTEILIVGTFNPETKNNPAKFFYGRERNYLWQLVPTAFEHCSLKDASHQQKQSFIAVKKIDFIDMIKAVEVDVGKEANYADAYIDRHVKEWTNVEAILKGLPQIKKVIVTRKTFGDVPNIHKKVQSLRDYCERNQIVFECLPTPARFYNQQKQDVWSAAFSK